MGQFFGFLLGYPCGCILVALACAKLLVWHRARLVQRILANTAGVTGAWVIPPDENYSVHYLKVAGEKGEKVVAVHREVQRVVPLLERSGIQVLNVPDWARDIGRPPPLTPLDENPAWELASILARFLTPMFVAGAAGTLVWALYR